MIKTAQSRLSGISSPFCCPEMCTPLFPMETEEHFGPFSGILNVKDPLVNIYKLLGVEEMPTEVETMLTCGWVPQGKPGNADGQARLEIINTSWLAWWRNHALLICVCAWHGSQKSPPRNLLIHVGYLSEEISQSRHLWNLQDPRPHLCTSRSATITVVSLGHGNQIAFLHLFQVFITLRKSIILLLVISRMILKMGNWYGNIQINTSSLSDIDCPWQKQNYLYQKTTFLKI